jgi:hypothetical protein
MMPYINYMEKTIHIGGQLCRYFDPCRLPGEKFIPYQNWYVTNATTYPRRSYPTLPRPWITIPGLEENSRQPYSTPTEIRANSLDFVKDPRHPLYEYNFSRSRIWESRPRYI